MSGDEAAAGGIQSLDAALRLLKVLAEAGGAASLSDLARRCEMPPPKVHRYLASFLNAGIVEQAGRSGKYDLGPEALRLGLAAIARHDFVNRAADSLTDLAAQTGMSVLLSVWGNEGATVIRWERAEVPTVTSMGLGTTMPLLHSATGRAFLAWAPPAAITGRIEAELQRARAMPGLLPDITPDTASVAALRERIRGAGLATADGSFIPGLVALAAPVLDWQGEAQCVVTLIGTLPAALAPQSPQAQALVDFCRAQSVTP
ncbi:MAG: IclR family transcriptional regulator [Rhodobacter sp.]|nr:IclR family transcriptional regulator [Paracoccaceae bacterium]MCC0077415.1 IclR family transcriptional regulator [Rhodobacter sp.]